MSALDLAEAPFMAGTRPPPARSRLLPGRSAKENPFESLPLAAYEQGVWRQPSLFMRAWLVSDPAGLKRVLIDKVANYPKMPMEQRFFRALFGEGLLSSDGETLIQRDMHCVNGTGPLRFAAYLHLYDPSRPLLWQGGEVTSPPIQEVPVRLQMLMPYNACS